MSYRIIPNTGQTLALGSVSVSSTAFGAQTYMVRLASTGNCHIEFDNPATSASALLAAGREGEVFRVRPGGKVSVIQDGSSTGNLSVVELCL